MRNIGAYVYVKRLVAEAVVTATPTAVVVDRAQSGSKRYDAVSLWMYVGAGGITFNGTNFIALKVEESDDNSTYNNVAAAPVSAQGGGGVVFGTSNLPGTNFAQEADANGYVRLINAAKAGADTDPFKVDYVGNKRYVRVSMVFGGTHGTGTNVALWAGLGHPDILPAA